jgi:hypothetical protein
MKALKVLWNLLDLTIVIITIALLLFSCTKRTEEPAAPHYRYFFKCVAYGSPDSVTVSVPSIFPNAPTHGAQVPSIFPGQVPGTVCLKAVLDSQIVNP